MTTLPIAGPLLVAGTSNPAKVAGAIAGVIREKGRVELQAIGVQAVNQTMKAIAIARGYVAPQGMDLICTPFFMDVEIGGEDRTALRFRVEPRVTP